MIRSKVRTLYESVDNSMSKTDVLGIFQGMFDKFWVKNQEAQNGKDRKKVYEMFTDNIMPGGFDFCVDAKYVDGAKDSIDMKGYLDVKHGCWLNSLDFVNKYGDLYPDHKLAFGIIVEKRELRKIRDDLENGFTPLEVKFIDHGFLVNESNGEVFDPTLGVNDDYVYFYKLVDEDIISSLKYNYKNDGQWNVEDFAYWTKVKIRECRNKYFLQGATSGTAKESFLMGTPLASPQMAPISYHPVRIKT